ncbi:MAG TPA: hydroxymethylbilane synthase [Gammaproteobacteria bacterium]|nr:hydroxymethylbilane synthase [Gammaproteobacteria bacterium]
MSPLTSLAIATRKSPLALWQATHVRDALLAHHPWLDVQIIGMRTRGDKILNSPLAAVGGKGLFTKELEDSLLGRRADIAVHSMKDVTVEIPAGLAVPVMLKREDVRDVLLSIHHADLDALPHGARVGTASLRRQCQLKAWRDDVKVLSLRGNIGTRVKKLEAGEYDAIVLAAAGVKRLGLEGHVRQHLPVETMLPAIGQGAIGIQCRSNDARVLELITPLNDTDTLTCVLAERALNRGLGGGCQVPIAGHASLHGPQLILRALVGRPDGTEIIRGEISGPVDELELLGRSLAEDLLSRGAGAILEEFGPYC